MRTLTSDEVNFLVYRYLLESGFRHTSFSFGHESLVHKSNISGKDVPPGALISFLQKGIQYMEVEARLKSKDKGDGEPQYNSPLELLSGDMKSLPYFPAAAASNGAALSTGSSATASAASDELRVAPSTPQTRRSRSNSVDNRRRGATTATAARDKAGEEMEIDDEEEETSAQQTQQTSQPKGSRATGAKTTKAQTKKGAAKEEESIHIPDNKVTVLRGHSHEVFICAWSPTQSNIIASGSGDSTARIWTLPPGPCGTKSTISASANPIVLQHSMTSEPTLGTGSKDVTTLDWSADGRRLATGSYDGKARIWSHSGDLLATLQKHKGPIFSLKWNKKGDYLLSGSVDNTAIIWDVSSGTVKQQFRNHQAPTLDVDWRTDTSFATCSTDKMIYVCKLGQEQPLRVMRGHEDEVNAIRWDPSGNLLASCSDDYTAKIWNMNQENCVYDFREHTKEIYTIKWSPTGVGTRFTNRDLVLASASFDASIKIWDMNHGICKYSLTKHSDPVYSVAFSPDGEYIASGSFDKNLHIWSVKDGQLVKTYNGKGSIFEVCWNAAGDKVAACFSNSVTEEFQVCVLDFRK